MQTSEIEVAGTPDLCHAPFFSNAENEAEISKSGWGGPRANSGGLRPGAGRKPKQPQTARASLPEARWLCVRVITGREQWAKLELAQRGFESHFPRYMMERKNPDQTREWVIRDMFPGYGFVWCDIGQDWRDIRSADEFGSVKHLYLVNEFRPAYLPHGIVEALQARGRPEDGVIDENYRGPEFPALGASQAVRIIAGPFADLHGICRWSNQKRIAVLLDLMGKQVEVNLKRGEVERV